MNKKEFEESFKEGFMIPFNFLSKFKPKSWNMFFVKLSLWIILIDLLIQFSKYPNLDYFRIITLILMGISAKLSWIIQLNQN